MSFLDKKGWIQETAEEIADLWYSKDYFELTTETQLMLLARAEQEYADMWADRVDALYEAELERRMERANG